MSDRAAPPSPTDPPAPRLARLDLHGFKSFATRTVFQFEPGITAVVGPNGSGKSNVADAVRWVLGETSHHALRSKRTEDVIFAGGRGRAPAGMAEVTVTFNNEDGWLPSEFTEVTVTRRAFRGGDTQYFINGRRVRLKDIAQLTASLGQSHTVVGQGLVDAALSQRAEERRGLFEHAADLTGIQLRVAEAERNLNEADANGTRLSDLLTELEPRLRTLERAARQAREWQGLRERLTALQRGHYRRLLAAAHERRRDAEAVLAGDEHELTGVRDALERLIAERTGVQATAARARDALASHDARLDAMREGMRRIAHERDLVAERSGALERRRADMRDTQAGLDEQVSRVETELSQVGDGLRSLVAEVETARASGAAQAAAAGEERRARSERERQAAELLRAIAAGERALTDLAQRRSVLDLRLEGARNERVRMDREARQRDERIAELEGELAAFDAEDAAIADRIGDLEARLSALRDAASTGAAEAASAADAVAGLERRLSAAVSRLDVLRKVHESGTGLHAGVRQVMQWRADHTLTGIRGTLAELIAVDAAYDTAIEVALGGHLQDVVVDRWRDAEAAIALLKRHRAGRATFQPLDSVRLRGVGQDAIGNGDGVRGAAADLVRSDEDVSVVVRALLGRTVVVDDLAVARRVLTGLRGGWSTVTLAGEIVRSGGSVSGGSAVRESGVLGRERELRDLPAVIATLERDVTVARQHHATLVAASREHEAERGRLESARAAAVAQRRERAGQRQRLAGWLADQHAQREVASGRMTAADKSRADHEAEIATLDDRERGLVGETDGLRRRHEAVLTELAQRQEAAGEGETALVAAQRGLAALEERLRAERRRESSLVSQRTSLAEETSLRAQRFAELDGERTALAGQRERLEREIASLTAARESAERDRAPLGERVTAAERDRDTHERRIDTMRQDAQERERGLAQHELAVERVRAELAGIHRRIADDLGLDSPDDLLIAADVDDTEPALDDDHAAVEREIARLRDRLRRVGYVGDDVVAEFERESEHDVFLRAQLADVQAAAASLRRMLAELRETMRRRFEETFAKVSEAFTDAFVTLFGGGTARLVLTEDEGGATGGIDIVAQPPGKRLQSLGLLSGGERALTAVALLFAILRVNPSPFVLLDEVDAALDEANVVRFRDELRKLAAETQAIVITHNRGTVEIADTLYGVTMGGDGVSQVLSLRLSELPLDEDVDGRGLRDIPSVTTGLPTR